MSNYWRSAVEAGLEEVGIQATPEQIERLAEGFAITDEQSSVLTHRPDSPLLSENQRLKDELAKERSLVWCGACHGLGTYRLDGPSHYSLHDCPKCDGKGKRLP